MIKEFARPVDFINKQSQLPSFRYRDSRIIKHLSKLDLSGYILDIGERTVMTQRMEDALNIKIGNTMGDLDEKFFPFEKRDIKYDVIIFSHVIEHLFNPLLCLKGIKKLMKPDATLVICTPIKPHYLPWGKGHFSRDG